MIRRAVVGGAVIAVIIAVGVIAVAGQPQWIARSSMSGSTGEASTSGDATPGAGEGEGPEGSVVIDLTVTGAADLSQFADENGDVALIELPWYRSGWDAPALALPGGASIVTALNGQGFHVLVAETLSREGLELDHAAFATPDGSIIEVFSQSLNGEPAIIDDGLAVERLADGAEVAWRAHNNRVWVQYIKGDRQVILIILPGPMTPEAAYAPDRDSIRAESLVQLAQLIAAGA